MITNPCFLTFEGEPITIRAPAPIVIVGEAPALTPKTLAQVRSFYYQFVGGMKLSLAPNRVEQRTFLDGTVVRIVSIQGKDTIYVTPVDGGEVWCEITMDSGIVDMKGIAPLNPHKYDPGVLHRTAYVQTYISSPPGPFQRVIDRVRLPGVVGKAPADARPAKSFSDRPAGKELLLQKKQIAAYAPPSVFTGKTRLYVQALYGAPIGPALLYSALVDNPLGTPFITVQNVDVTTSTGVYLDASNGHHWLVRINYGKATFYPMRASGCAEKLRKLLLNMKISEKNRERIEAYILSTSYPVQSKGQVVNIASSTFPTDEMGYGWHFNWKGDTCDIVQTTTEQPPELVAAHLKLQRSTHCRIVCQLQGGVWSAALQVIEGPIDWYFHPMRNVFAYPLWGAGGLARLGNLYGLEPFGNAPVYAFYKRNELQLMRFAISHSVTPTSRTSEPGWFGGHTYNGTTNDVIYGDQGGEYIDYEQTPQDTFTLSCGAESFIGSFGEKLGAKHSIIVLSTTWPSSPNSHDIIPGAPPFVYNVTTGYPRMNLDGNGVILPSTDGYATIYHYGGELAAPGVAGTAAASFTYSQWLSTTGLTELKDTTILEESLTYTIVVVPYYDAEAVYLHRSESILTHETGKVSTIDWGGWIVKDRTSVIYTGWNGWYGSPDPPPKNWTWSEDWGVNYVYQAQAVPSGVSILSTDYIDVVNRADDSKSVFVGSAGVCDFVMQSTSQFYSTDALIEQFFETYSSVNGAVYAPWALVNKDNVPTDPATLGPSVYVGWA